MSDIVNESNGEMQFFGEMFGNDSGMMLARHDAMMATIQNTR